MPPPPPLSLCLSPADMTELPAVSSGTNAGAVAGGVVGVIAVIASLTVLGVIFGIVGYSLYKKRRTY